MPFLRSYLEAWNAFARGGAYPTCAGVWETTSTASTPVAAWLTNASLRSRQSTQITALQTELSETKQLLAKVVTRLENLEKKPPTRQQPKPIPAQTSGDGAEDGEPQLTSKHRRTAEWKAKNAARDAEKAAAEAAAKEGAPAAAPSAADAQASHKQRQN